MGPHLALIFLLLTPRAARFSLTQKVIHSLYFFILAVPPL